VEEYVGLEIPPYAILSHCWGKEEVSLQEMQNSSLQLKLSHSKIWETCQLAQSNGIDYIWVDTCCIDKTSSAELSEAINSMFEWYSNAIICYTFLHDLDPSTETDVGLRDCRWFTRGWTLQELLAPRDVSFYDSSWTFRGTKKDLVGTISEITQIHPSYLVGTIPLRSSLRLTHAAVKMSWMSCRKTTRVEDMAYCLLGIFDVNIPLLYGEGVKAFRRLQEVILVNDGDLSILAWKPDYPLSGIAGVLAKSPSEFSWIRNINMDFSVFVNRKECSLTCWGLRLTGNLLQQPTLVANNQNSPPYFRYLLDLDCWAWAMEKNPTERVWLKWPRLAPGRQDFTFGIYLRKHGASSYCRDFADTNSLAILDPRCLPPVLPAETLSMHTHHDSLPQSYLTNFPDDPYGNADHGKIIQLGVHLPRLPGLEIVPKENQGLWDASNSIVLCTYYELAAIITIRPNNTVYDGMSEIILLLKPLHIYHKVNIYLLFSSSTISEFSLERIAKMNDENFMKLSGTNQSLRSEDQKWDINCSASLEIVPSISLHYKVLHVNMSISRVTRGPINDEG
jgi:hypothetical protein